MPELDKHSDLGGSRRRKPRHGPVYRILRALLVLLAVLVVAVVLLLSTGPGGRMVATIASRLGSSANQQLDIDSVTGILSGQTRIGHIVISDAEGVPWLAIRDIAIDWSPVALLSGNLAVDRLSAAHVELDRLPEQESKETASGGSFALPLNIGIKELDFPEIVLGEDIAGSVARFELGGALRLDRQLSDVFADLDMARIDGVGGKASIDAAIDIPQEKFDLDVSVSEPAGGVLAHLAGLPERQAVAISASSNGSLKNWLLSVTGAIDGKQAANADLRVQAGNAGHTFDLSATGALDRFLPPLAASLFEGDSEILAVGLVEPENTGIQIDVLTLDSASLHAEGQGRIARTGEMDFSASVQAAGDDVQLSFGGADNAVSIVARHLDVSMEGAASDATITFDAKVPEVSSEAFSASGITLSGRFEHTDIANRVGSGTIKLRAQSAGAANAMLARALAGEIALDVGILLEGPLVNVTAAKLASATAAIEMKGEVELTKLEGEGALLAEMNSAIISEQVAEMAGRTISANADFTISADSAASVSDLHITTDNLTLTGSASLDAEKNIAAGITAELADLGAITTEAAGGVVLEAEITGPMKAPEVSATLTGNSVSLKGQAIENLRLSANGVLDPDEPQADIELSGAYRGQPIEGTVRLTSKNGQNKISPLVLTLEENRIEGALTLNDDFLPTGTIRLDLPDIAPLAALALADYTGAATGSLVFDVDNGTPSIKADIEIAALSGSGFSLSGGRVEITATDYLSSPVLDGRVSVASVDAGGLSMGDIAVDFTREGDWTIFNAMAETGDLPFRTEGRVRMADGETRLEIDSARLTYQGLPVTLNPPAIISMRGGVTTIEKLSVSLEGGTVNVSGTAGEVLAIDVVLSSLPLGIVERFAPGTGLSGSISGTVEISGTPADPLVRYDLQGANVGAAALSEVSSQSLSLSVKGAYRKDEVDFRAEVRSEGGLQLDANGKVGLSGAKALAIKINGKAPFGVVSALLASQGMSVDGIANVDLSIGGTGRSPAFSGSITSAGARFVDTNSGIVIEDISFNIGLDNQAVRLRSLKGNLAAGGELAGSGTVGLVAGSGYPADVVLKISNGRYADGKLVAVNFDADLTLKGPLAGLPMLGGTIRLDQTTITVPSTLPPSIARLDITHENAGGAVNAQAARLKTDKGGDNGGGDGGLALDLTIEAPRRIFVRGRGIDAEFGGSLNVGGTAGAPVASGGFELIRGRLTVLGKRLDFDRGDIGFTGSMIPTLDFSASTSAGSAIASVQVTGPANAPEFSFTSVPGLPEDEVLALLIFGRSLSDLSPLQIAQLAAAAAELTGVTSGDGILEKLRKATGIDDLDLRTDEKTGDTSVAVGKYLNDRTYIGIEKGTSTSTGKARIDLDIGRGVKLRGEASTDGETKGGIFFEHNY